MATKLKPPKYLRAVFILGGHDSDLRDWWWEHRATRGTAVRAALRAWLASDAGNVSMDPRAAESPGARDRAVDAEGPCTFAAPAAARPHAAEHDVSKPLDARESKPALSAAASPSEVVPVPQSQRGVPGDVLARLRSMLDTGDGGT